MKFVVTCLKDDGTRVLASKSKVFTSVPEAIKYSGTVAGIRTPSIVPVPTDTEHAAEFIFDNVVEHNPQLLEMGDPEELKEVLRYEIGGEDIMVVFAPGNDVCSAFHKMDMQRFTSEIERLILDS